MKKNDHVHVGWCQVHEKLSYNSRRAAKQACRTIHQPGLREYRCTEVYGYWHIGHLPQATVYGLKTVREVYGQVAS